MKLLNGSIQFRLEGRIVKSTIVTGLNRIIEGIVIDLREHDSRVIMSIETDVSIEIIDCRIFFERYFDSTTRFLLNGYQSWSESRIVGSDYSQLPIPGFLRPILNNYKLYAYGDYNFTEYKTHRGAFHSVSYTAITTDVVESDANMNRLEFKNTELIGSMIEDSAFTIINFDTSKSRVIAVRDLKGVEISGDYVLFDLCNIYGDLAVVTEEYFNLLGYRPKANRFITGWTSWYNYYTGITEDIIDTNIDAFVKNDFKIDVFQIDDGYQKSVGDWLETNSKFPEGMGRLAEKIKSAGMKPGLWLAPFICEKNSDIYRDKKHWIAKDRRGRLVRAGNSKGWSGDFFSLDIYNQEVIDYLKEVFDLVLNRWGFEIVKLDFLYAVAICPPKGVSRGQAMRKGMTLLRELVGDREILGCGVPLLSAAGLVDYCRIGPDVALKWEDQLLKWLNYRERVSTFSAINNAITRFSMDSRLFYNDPDVFILRNNNNSLTKSERFTLYILNILFGSLVFTSDNIDEYDSDTYVLYRFHLQIKTKRVSGYTIHDNLLRVRAQINGKNLTVITNIGEKDLRDSETGAELTPHSTLIFCDEKEGCLSLQSLIDLFK